MRRARVAAKKVITLHQHARTEPGDLRCGVRGWCRLMQHRKGVATAAGEARGTAQGTRAPHHTHPRAQVSSKVRTARCPCPAPAPHRQPCTSSALNRTPPCSTPPRTPTHQPWRVLRVARHAPPAHAPLLQPLQRQPHTGARPHSVPAQLLVRLYGFDEHSGGGAERGRLGQEHDAHAWVRGSCLHAPQAHGADAAHLNHELEGWGGGRRCRGSGVERGFGAGAQGGAKQLG